MRRFKVSLLNTPDASDPENKLLVVGWKVHLGDPLSKDTKQWGVRVALDRSGDELFDTELVIAGVIKSVLLAPEEVKKAILESTIGVKCTGPFYLGAIPMNGAETDI